MTALASLAPLMSAGWGKTISPLFSSLRARQAHGAHVPRGPGRKGRAGVSGKDATQLHSKNSCKNTSKHGTAARKEFLQQDRLGPHRVLTPGSVNTHWAILSARPCASVPHAPLTPSHALRSTSYTPQSIIFLSHVKSGILSPIHKEDERVHLHPVLGGAPLSP